MHANESAERAIRGLEQDKVDDPQNWFLWHTNEPYVAALLLDLFGFPLSDIVLASRQGAA